MKFAFAQSSVSVAVVAILGFSTSGVVVEAKKDVISLRGGRSSVALAANETLNNATSVNNTSITSVAVNSTTPANTSSVVTEISTNETSSIVEKCTGNTPGWTDIEGDGCEWYETFELPGCPLYGDFTEVNTTSGEPLSTVANDNCCHCFGTAVSIVYCIMNALIV